MDLVLKDDVKINYEKYLYFVLKAMELQNEPNSKKAYEEQMNQSKITKEKMDSYYDLRDKIIDLYQAGVEKIKGKDFEDSKNFSKVEVLNNVIKEKLNKTEKYEEFSKYLKEIPELVEAGNLEQELQDKFFDYAKSQLQLDKVINDSKKNLFSKEYMKKMDEYAEEGILLYFLETPDIPILDEKISKEDVLNVFLFDDCQTLKVFFHTFVTLPNPTPSMEKKIDDIIVTVNNLIDGYYRSAARNMFALLESEYKNISKALEGFFTQERQYKNGKERSLKIEELVKLSDMPYAKESWNKINKYYSKIVKSISFEGVVDRNAVVHGDYYSEKLDITAYDIVKLLLLFLSLRSLGDYIQNHAHVFEQAYQYTMIHFAQVKIGK